MVAEPFKSVSCLCFRQFQPSTISNVSPVVVLFLLLAVLSENGFRLFIAAGQDDTERAALSRGVCIITEQDIAFVSRSGSMTERCPRVIFSEIKYKFLL